MALIEPEPHQSVLAKIAAGRLLTRAGYRSSTIVDSFSGWMLTAFTSSLALLVSQVDSLMPILEVARLVVGLKLFLVMVLFGAAQKYLASVIAAIEAGTRDGEELTELRQDFDPKVFFSELQAAPMFPARFIFTRISGSLLSGDYAVNGRLVLRLLQIQSVIMSIEIIAALATAWTVISAIAPQAN